MILNAHPTSALTAENDALDQRRTFPWRCSLALTPILVGILLKPLLIFLKFLPINIAGVSVRDKRKPLGRCKSASRRDVSETDQGVHKGVVGGRVLTRAYHREARLAGSVCAVDLDRQRFPGKVWKSFHTLYGKRSATESVLLDNGSSVLIIRQAASPAPAASPGRRCSARSCRNCPYLAWRLPASAWRPYPRAHVDSPALPSPAPHARWVRPQPVSAALAQARLHPPSVR
jgi:hypothetical protein